MDTDTEDRGNITEVDSRMLDLVPIILVIIFVLAIPAVIVRSTTATARSFKRLFQACIGYEGTNGAAY